MPHVYFNPDSIDWKGFFAEPQVGGAYFRGVPYMRGHGIGAVFKNLYRFLLPLASSAGKAVGREGLSVGARVLGDIAGGEEPKSALSVHTREGLRNLMRKASDHLGQKGTGRRRKRKRKRNTMQKGRGVSRIHTYPIKGKKGKGKRKAHSVEELFTGRSIAGSPPKSNKRRKKRVDSLGVY
jgi:hypothetical protein